MKLAFVGGGSYAWGPPLLADLALSTHLTGEVVLHDIDPVAGERLARLGTLLTAQSASPLAMRFTPSLEEALDGADFVVLSITTGGLAAMDGDLGIPESYGIMQPVGDTVGPGGLSRALRNIPVVVRLARAMEERCPKAWLINVTNPMTTLCRAVGKATGIRVIGLCHEVRSVQQGMATLLGSDDLTRDWQVAGVNHLPWITTLETAAAARIMETAEKALARRPLSADPFHDHFRVKLDLLAAYGTFPAAGDRHLAEFFPHYLRRPDEALARYGVRMTTIEHRVARSTAAETAVRRILEGEDPLPESKPSGEQVVPIIEALLGHGSGMFVVNVRNDGRIAGLPEDVVVECMAEIDSSGIGPVPSPSLPPAALAWTRTHATVQELIVSSALEQRMDLAVQALLLDPLSWRLNRAELASLVKVLATHNARFGAPPI
ncbi:MAG TPA: hypothetical protein VNL71_10145 [Chloroflexota bacterium]|nr:hypothetical protein [Chloroflexota bacterium]